MRRWSIRAAALLAAVYAVGLLSGAVSRAACVRDTEAANLAFFAGARNGTPAARLTRSDLVDRFDELQISLAGAITDYRVTFGLLPMRLLEPRKSLPAWRYALAEMTPWPFVVRVQYGRYATFSYGGCGSAGTRLYLVAFGKARLVRQWPVVMW